MGFFDEEAGVQKYLEMVEGTDGKEWVDKLAEYLAEGSTVLELGMGPGKDLDLLAERFTTTGSDTSRLLLDRYQALHPEADLLKLDAITINTDRRFDAIYSNKVLHHLPRADLSLSLARQRDVLEPSGIALHTFWLGDGDMEHEGLLFTYYAEAGLRGLVTPYFEVLDAVIYGELEDKDSICLVMRRLG
jgi:cyclopropane fatty-acyl-phospholipid synthase-like methyltransferase